MVVLIVELGCYDSIMNFARLTSNLLISINFIFAPQPPPMMDIAIHIGLLAGPKNREIEKKGGTIALNKFTLAFNR